MNTQLRKQFDPETLKKVGKGALIAGGGAMAIYLLQWLTTLDLGQFTLVAGAIAGILINAIKEYFKGQ